MFAAAPDLLAALKALDEKFDFEGSVYEGESGWEAVTSAKAAIRKAEEVVDAPETAEERIKKLEGQRDALITACDELNERLYTWIEGHLDDMVRLDIAAMKAGKAAIQAAQPQKEVK